MDRERRLGKEGPWGTLQLFVSSLTSGMMLTLDGGIVRTLVQFCLNLLSAN